MEVSFYLFVKKKYQKKVIRKLSNCKKINFGFENSGVKTCFFKLISKYFLIIQKVII